MNKSSSGLYLNWLIFPCRCVMSAGVYGQDTNGARCPACAADVCRTSTHHYHYTFFVCRWYQLEWHSIFTPKWAPLNVCTIYVFARVRAFILCLQLLCCRLNFNTNWRAHYQASLNVPIEWGPLLQHFDTFDMSAHSLL